MKKILYISNTPVPYRVRFFNELAKKCDLTVLYERKKSSNRNQKWAGSEKQSYAVKYLKGIPFSREGSFSFGILKEVFSGYDAIIVGCYNSLVQMMAILTMRLLRIPYIVNLDGEPFLEESGLKSSLKRFFLRGAKAYLTAGEKAAESLRKALGEVKTIPYYFSSLSEQELREHREMMQEERSEMILIIGQYFDYKGMDIALETAKLDPSLQYKFVGMGSRTELFVKEHEIPDNVEIVPFLQKQELEQEYRNCAMLVLPSRQECWGLVVNEAASFRTPIVSTWGSGAAVEFLADEYPQYLAKPGDAEDLLNCIHTLWSDKNKEMYAEFLLRKSEQYSIERNVTIHMSGCGEYT